ncbi:MAG: hypothetical protein V4755_07605 [Curtobacterium sp.]
MSILDDRADRNTLRAWVDAIEPSLPEALRTDTIWRALADAARRPHGGCDHRLAADAAAWLHEAVLPAAADLAGQLGFGAEWQDYCRARTIDAARVAMRSISTRLLHARLRAEATTSACAVTGSTAATIAALSAGHDVQLLQGLRRVVALAAYDRTVAGSAVAAAALLAALPHRPTLLAEIDPVGALTVFLADVRPDPVIAID